MVIAGCSAGWLAAGKFSKNSPRAAQPKAEDKAEQPTHEPTDTIEIRLDKVEVESGHLSKECIASLTDETAYVRACQAYRSGFRIEGIAGARQHFEDSERPNGPLSEL